MVGTVEHDHDNNDLRLWQTAISDDISASCPYESSKDLCDGASH